MLKTITVIVSLLPLAGCEALMAISDDPCRDRPGCTADFPAGNTGPATFTDADGTVIERWPGFGAGTYP